MSFNGQDVRDDARKIVEDDGSVWDDEAVLTQINHGLQSLRNMRPDLFVGRYSGSIALANISDDVPLEDQYRPALADFLVARLSLTQDDEGSATTAAAFMKLSTGQM